MAQTKYHSKLLTHEDYWAIWLGGFLIMVGFTVFFFLPKQEIISKVTQLTQATNTGIPYETVESIEAKMELKSLSSAKTTLGQQIGWLLRTPQKWQYNPLIAFYKPTVSDQAIPDETTAAALSTARQAANVAHQNAASRSYADEGLNKQAAQLAIQWKTAYQHHEEAQKKLKITGYNLLGSLGLLLVSLTVLFGLGAAFMGTSFAVFSRAFAGIFLLATLAHMLGKQADMAALGFGYALWAIVLGVLLANTLGTPQWLKPALQTEFYIKTGIVLLGAEILFSKILAIGLPGIFVAWVVTPIVLITTFWFGQKIIKMTSKTLNIVISADMSVCGVSAAIATAAACNAKKEELTVAIGLSMAFTSVMMIALPAFIKAMDMPEVLGGAWIGGTIDATGAVVAAGAFLGDTALQVAATTKMIQNMMIGVISFFVAFYWAARVERGKGQRVGLDEIWKRFPKFILGFVGASVVASLAYTSLGSNLGDIFIDRGIIRGFTKYLHQWFFCLAFVSIGLSLDFKSLKSQFKGGKPLVLYLAGQSLNLLLTLLMAYLMFYVVFPEITAAL